MKVKYCLFPLLFIIGTQVFASSVPNSTVFYEALKNKDKNAFISFVKTVDKNYKPEYR